MAVLNSGTPTFIANWDCWGAGGLKPVKGFLARWERARCQMHQAAWDQLIFVGDAVLRHLNQMVTRPGRCAIESPREQEL